MTRRKGFEQELRLRYKGGKLNGFGFASRKDHDGKTICARADLDFCFSGMTLRSMSKFSHLGLGVLLCIGAGICGMFGFLAFLATAAGKDSVPGASLLDVEFLAVYLVFGGLVFGCLWGAWRKFKRALRIASAELSEPSAASAPQPPAAVRPATPDEKLAHLVKGPK